MSQDPPAKPLQDAGTNLDLMFITQTTPKTSKDVLPQIRKHVMKDIGKARRKYGKIQGLFRFTLGVPDSLDLNRPPAEPHYSVQQPNRPTVRDGDISRVNQNTFMPLESSGLHNSTEPFLHQQTSQPAAVVVPPIERLWTGRLDPFVRYPIKMDQHSLQLIDHVFDDRYGNTPPYRDAWLPLGMTDAATFYQVLSNAALNLASLRARYLAPETRVPMMYHTRAVMIVKQKISNKIYATSDSVIASITAFACYSHVIGNQAGWHIHMNAVKEIVRLRGGIDNFNSNRLLRMALFWVDVGGSCTEDIQPIFPIPTTMLLESLGADDLTPLPLLAEQLSHSWNETNPEYAEIMTIMDDIRSFMFYLKGEVQRTRGNVYCSGELFASNILPLQHRLLSLVSPSNDNAQRKVDILRLGCTLCIAEIRRLFGIMGVISSHQAAKLRALLEKKTQDWEPFALLKTWVLAMGAMESRGCDREWFFAELGKSRAEVGVGRWECLPDKFRQILWFDDVHDQMFLELCNGVDPFIAVDHFLGGSRFGGYGPL
ncbi:hypothetical protein OIDMADRAFT_59618 [Oidiodendron maius Zn]|uniref:Transcription factor domain-containing protein n=1 Tax=Oidiodendron maius (strain Zn) TaxID=913774 RepID=A0A0C3H007_OIDMZ|nr:hypothetical protein OIDMADRAFT_59618 [Oidiodendron maius Zn]